MPSPLTLTLGMFAAVVTTPVDVIKTIRQHLVQGWVRGQG